MNNPGVEIYFWLKKNNQLKVEADTILGGFDGLEVKLDFRLCFKILFSPKSNPSSHTNLSQATNLHHREEFSPPPAPL